MITIRLPRADWGKAWRAMIEVVPVRLIADDPVYEVLAVSLGGADLPRLHVRGRAVAAPTG